ncbi:hypothetical protein SAMN02745165_01151 [Malonomonas rubra DSM 5091]|uniref:Uncharacterized protein n=1 Tax=Malonomonas rubra DSM 5091 TaxID=1122189 RepID=A0A1M6F4A4_MALRU|nr:hypothetical protein SAMN02745165_01151 [Malonomonas rubra DSM 5091]
MAILKHDAKLTFKEILSDIAVVIAYATVTTSLMVLICNCI